MVVVIVVIYFRCLWMNHFLKCFIGSGGAVASNKTFNRFAIWILFFDLWTFKDYGYVTQVFVSTT